MASKSSSSNVSASNYSSEPLSDDDLIRGFTLTLGAGGRKEKLSISMKKASACFRTSPRALDSQVWLRWTEMSSAIG